MNEGIHLDLDTWIVPGQIRKANLCRGLGNRYTPAGTEVLVAHNTPPPFQAAQNATTVNTRSSVAPCTAQRHTPASPECHPGICPIKAVKPKLPAFVGPFAGGSLAVIGRCNIDLTTLSLIQYCCPFACICKHKPHSHTHWRGCPGEGWRWVTSR